MTWLLWLGLAVCLLTAAAFGLSACGSKRWAASVRALTHRLEADRNDSKVRSGPPAHFDSRELQDLPAPVQRYFRAVLKEGQPIISAVAIEMTGTFNMSTTTQRWRPFTSRQRVATQRPGFLWDAQVSMAPDHEWVKRTSSSWGKVSTKSEARVVKVASRCSSEGLIRLL